MKTYKMAVSFKLNHADFLPLLNSTVFKPVSFVSSSLSCTTASRSFSNKVSSISFKSLTKASNKPFPWTTHLILLVTFQLNSNIKLFVNLLCRLNSSILMWISHPCLCVNVLMFYCHPHVPFLAKPLFTTVNLHRTVTVHNVNYFTYQRCWNVTSFPLPSWNLLSSPGIKSHLSPLTLKLNILPRPLSPLGTLSLPNFHHVSLSNKICLFLNLLNQPTQYILVINILTDILFFLVYLKFCSNISGTLIHYIKQYNHFLKLSFDCFVACMGFNTTYYIEMDSFISSSKVIILVAICIVLCLQNKTFCR